MRQMKDEASQLTEVLDAGWDELDSVPPPASFGPESTAPELAALDDGWDLDLPGMPARAPAGRGLAGPRPLTKKERRELERRLRAQALQRKNERKAERKERRRAEAQGVADQRSAQRLAEEQRARVASRKAARRTPEPERSAEAEPPALAPSADVARPRRREPGRRARRAIADADSPVPLWVLALAALAFIALVWWVVRS